MDLVIEFLITLVKIKYTSISFNDLKIILFNFK